MSGINEITKKAKISLDEMYNNQPVGVLDNQLGGKLESKPANQNDVQPDNNTPSYPTKQQSNNKEPPHEIAQENQIINPSTIYRKISQQKKLTYKVTFNLTENIYKDFNDLYANRILQGRKTDKSEMICEAIQWLIKMDEQLQ